MAGLAACSGGGVVAAGNPVRSTRLTAQRLQEALSCSERVVRMAGSLGDGGRGRATAPSSTRSQHPHGQLSLCTSSVPAGVPRAARFGANSKLRTSRSGAVWESLSQRRDAEKRRSSTKQPGGPPDTPSCCMGPYQRVTNPKKPQAGTTGPRVQARHRANPGGQSSRGAESWTQCP